jgi:hypothetical protein
MCHAVYACLLLKHDQRDGVHHGVTLFLGKILREAVKQLLRLFCQFLLKRDEHSRACFVCIFCASSGEKHDALGESHLLPMMRALSHA